MNGKGLESLLPKKAAGSDSSSEHTASQPFAPLRPFPGGAAFTPPSPPRERSVPPRAERTVTAPHEFASVRKPIERESVFQIEVEKIRPNPYQPRRAFHDGGLAELTSSIRDFGVLQPLVVTKREQETAAGTEVFYELVAGERRLLAAKRAGLERVPAVVKAVDSHRAKLEMALIENLQRSDLTPLETARAYTRLQEEFGLTQREIGERVGKSREAVANTLRLLNLSPEAQSALAEGKLNETQARTLLSVEAPDARAKLFADFLAGRGGRVGVPRVRSGPTPVSPEDAATARALEERLSAPVRVVRKGKGGRIEITFYSDEEYLGVRSRLLGEEW